MVFFKGRPQRLELLGRSDNCLNDIAEALGELGNSDSFCDVEIHCRSQTKVSTNKCLLSQRSKLLRLAFETDSSVLLCPDFDYEPMRKVLRLLSHGKVITESQVICDSMLDIMKVLQIDIDVSAFPIYNFDLARTSSVTSTPNGDQTSLEGIEANSTAEYQDETSRLGFELLVSGPRLYSGDDEIAADDIAETEESSIAASEMITDIGSVSIDSDGFGNNSSVDISTEEPEAKSVAGCDICGKKFGTTFALNRHKKKHSKKIPVSEKTVVAEHQNDQSALEQNFEGVERKPNVSLEFVSAESSAASLSPFEASSGETSIDENQNASNVVDAMAAAPSNPEFSRPVGNKVKFSCKHCNKLASSQGNMVMHLAGSHYRSRILEWNRNDEKLCRTCNKMFGNTQGLLYHIASVHKFLLDILSNDLSVDHLSNSTDKSKKKKKTKAKSEAVPSLDQQQHGDQDQQLQSQKRPQLHQGQPRKRTPKAKSSLKSVGDLKYQCHICPLKTQSYNLLLCHIGSRHFITELESQLTTSSSECPKCSRVIQRRDNLRRHLVISHGALNGLLPPKTELQVRTEIAEFQCHLCPKQPPNRLKFLIHMAASHFREKLLSEYSIDNACSICNKKCHDRKSVLLHIVINHQDALELLYDPKK